MGANNTAPPDMAMGSGAAPGESMNPPDTQNMTPQQRRMLAMMLMGQGQQQGGNVASPQGPLAAIGGAARAYSMLNGGG